MKKPCILAAAAAAALAFSCCASVGPEQAARPSVEELEKDLVKPVRGSIDVLGPGPLPSWTTPRTPLPAGEAARFAEAFAAALGRLPPETRPVRAEAAVLVPGKGAWTSAGSGAGVFYLASSGKMWTSAAIRSLEAEGRLSAADPVSAHLPWAGPAAAATIAQLLRNTSGLATFEILPECQGLGPAAPRTLAEAALARGLRFEPGSAYYYSNTGFLLAGLCADAALGAEEGEGYPRVLEALAARLGLGSVRAFRPGDVDALAVQGRFGDKLPPPGAAIGRPYAAGCVAASAEDAARFIQALVGSDLLPETQRRAMLSGFSRIDPEGSPPDVPPTYYGEGLSYIATPLGGILFHPGAGAGFSAIVAVHTETGIALAVVCDQFYAELDGAMFSLLKAALDS